MACSEVADSIRDEKDVSGAEEKAAPSNEGDAHMRDPTHSAQDNQMEDDSLPQLHVPKRKYVTTPQIHDSFDAVNNLCYSQPARLSGKNTRH